MLHGKRLSVPIRDATHAKFAKAYAQDVQATTKGYTKLRLTAIVMSNKVEMRSLMPSVRIKWELTDHHRSLLGELPERVDWRVYQKYEETAGSGSGAGGGYAASAASPPNAPPPTGPQDPSASTSESEDELSPRGKSVQKKKSAKSHGTPPRAAKEKDADASTDEEDEDLRGLSADEQEHDSDLEVGSTVSVSLA